MPPRIEDSVANSFNWLCQKTYNKQSYPYQDKLLRDGSRFRIVNKSRQIGMSAAIAAEALLYALYRPQTICLLISASERQSQNIMSYARSFMLTFKDALPFTLSEDAKTALTFENGSKLISLPNSPTTARGYAATRVYIDEFAHFLCGTDTEMLTAITPSISRGGSLTLVSTPYGESGQFFDTWHKSEYSKHEIPHQLCPDLDIGPLKATMTTDTFQQEFCCQFLSDATSYFPFELIKSCTSSSLPQSDIIETRNPLYAGFDVGRKHDASALVLTEKMPDGTFIVRWHETLQNMPYSAQERHLDTLIKRLKITELVIDQSGIGNQLAESLRAKHSCVTPITFTTATKESMATGTKKLFEDGSIVLPDSTELINQIHSVQRLTAPTGHIKFDAERTANSHADLFWALAMAVSASGQSIPFICDFGDDEVLTSAPVPASPGDYPTDAQGRVLLMHKDGRPVIGGG
jgi:phage FluMu gp28-like protein